MILKSNKTNLDKDNERYIRRVTLIDHILYLFVDT